MRKTLGWMLVVAIVIAGCDATTPTPTPSPSPTASPTNAPTATPAPSEAAALPISYGVVIPPFAPSFLLSLSNVTGPGFRPPSGRVDLAIQLLYDGLYRWDDQFGPVP